MNKFKRMVAGVFVATAALSSIGGAAFAAPAHAVTKTNCYTAYIGYYPMQKAVKSCYYNYNWFEEVFGGGVDGRYYERIPLLA